MLERKGLAVVLERGSKAARQETWEISLDL